MGDKVTLGDVVRAAARPELDEVSGKLLDASADFLNAALDSDIAHTLAFFGVMFVSGCDSLGIDRETLLKALGNICAMPQEQRAAPAAEYL